MVIVESILVELISLNINVILTISQISLGANNVLDFVSIHVSLVFPFTDEVILLTTY